MQVFIHHPYRLLRSTHTLFKHIPRQFHVPGPATPHHTTVTLHRRRGAPPPIACRGFQTLLCHCPWSSLAQCGLAWATCPESWGPGPHPSGQKCNIRGPKLPARTLRTPQRHPHVATLFWSGYIVGTGCTDCIELHCFAFSPICWFARIGCIPWSAPSCSC